MNEPIQYEKVKVKILLREPSEYNSWNLNRRMPQVGDVGYFIELLHTKGCPDHYVVEKTDPQTGENIWMSEFERNEIEPIK